MPKTVPNDVLRHRLRRTTPRKGGDGKRSQAKEQERLIVKNTAKGNDEKRSGRNDAIGRVPDANKEEEEEEEDEEEKEKKTAIVNKSMKNAAPTHRFSSQTGQLRPIARSTKDIQYSLTKTWTPPQSSPPLRWSRSPRSEAQPPRSFRAMPTPLSAPQ